MPSSSSSSFPASSSFRPLTVLLSSVALVFLLSLVLAPVPAQAAPSAIAAVAEAGAAGGEMAAEGAAAVAISRVKRNFRLPEDSFGSKRSGAKGFHEEIFDQGFGDFTTLKRKRRPNYRQEDGEAMYAGRGRATNPMDLYRAVLGHLIAEEAAAERTAAAAAAQD